MSRHDHWVYPTYDIVIDEEPAGIFQVNKLGADYRINRYGTALCVAYANDLETAKGYAEKFQEYYTAAQLQGYALHNDESREAVFSKSHRSFPVQASLAMPLEEFKKLISE
jgi:hypothetical protein